MIGYVKGTLISVQNGKVLLEVGGVGYEISVSNNTVVKLPAIEKQATIYTYLYVREDEMSLFGFYSLEEKAMFMKLISISGIGPKAAMSILSGMELRALAIAIITEDKKSIAKIKGVGKKTAERIILELKEKVTAEEADRYMGAFMAEAAELNAQTNWVTQLHAGAVRDVRNVLWNNLGPDVGGDISDHYQNFSTGLISFLNRFDSRLKTVLYCLDQGHQATLATISRAFGSTVRLGSAWWLCDTPIGMKRQLEYIGQVDLWYDFAGMVSDSRKLLSYGSRFEMFRRVLADVLGEAVEKGRLPMEIAENLAETMAYKEPKRFWGL